MEKRKLLLVDDEPNIRLSLGTILEMRGYEVVTAATVAEALAAIQASHFDVLVSDLNIGQPYDGFTVASATRRLHPDVATVMITGYPAFDDALESIRKQVDDYLIKPTDIDQLVDCIEHKLHSPHPAPSCELKRPVDVVRENSDVIVQRWLDMVESDNQLKAIPTTQQRRTGHLPKFLAALITQVVAQDAHAGEVAMDAAQQHGRQRRALGYTVPLLVRETRMLKTVIYGMLQEHLLEIKISRLIAEMISLSVSATEQLEMSIQGFLDNEPLANAS